MEQQIKMAAKLYQCRDTAKRFFKDEFKAKIEPYKQIIIKFNKAKGTDTLESVIEIAQNHITDGMGQMMLFAAAVEMIEPSV